MNHELVDPRIDGESIILSEREKQAVEFPEKTEFLDLLHEIYEARKRHNKSRKDFMLSKVQKYIHSISSTAPLEALQEACQLFEKEREQWKQERLALLKNRK